MAGTFTYMYHKYQPNVGKYTIRGSYGISYEFDGLISRIFGP